MHARFWLFAGLLILGSLTPLRAQQPWAMPPTGGQYANPAAYWPAGPGRAQYGAAPYAMPGNYGYQTGGYMAPQGYPGGGYPPDAGGPVQLVQATAPMADEVVPNGADPGLRPLALPWLPMTGRYTSIRMSRFTPMASNSRACRVSPTGRSTVGSHLRRALACETFFPVRTRPWCSGRLRAGLVWRQTGLAIGSHLRQGRLFVVAGPTPVARRYWCRKT